MTVSPLRKMLGILQPAERRQLVRLLAATVVMGLLEALGIALVMPFVMVVADPNQIFRQPMLLSVYDGLGFDETRQFLLFLGACVLAMLVVSSATSAGITWWQLRFSNLRNHTLSVRLFEKYLRRPYVFFLGENTGNLGKNILAEVGSVVYGVLVPALDVFARGVVSVSIIVLLFAVNPLSALVSLVVLGGSYVLIYSVTRRYLTKADLARLENDRRRYIVVAEAFGAIKDIKLAGCEQQFVRAYDVPARGLSEAKILTTGIGRLPRYALEVIAFGGIMGVVLVYLSLERDMTAVLPLLALYALASYRLLPALQQVFAGWAMVRSNWSGLELLYNDLVLSGDEPEVSTRASRPSVPSLKLRKRLELRGVGFQYPGSRAPLFSDLTLSIPADTTVGFAGLTGAGKTTLVDIILGLLAPTEGELLVDDVAIEVTTRAAWQDGLGYVPQSIYLADDTVARNIAFGVVQGDIDMAAVERAARIANLHDYVVHNLPLSYETVVGERGVRLSGGQRQRIGIARALYRDTSVLVLDEATSAVDGVTEDAIMSAVRQLSRRKTIILIAHRLTTLRDCDVIYLLDRGRIVERGTYAALMRTSERFRAMASPTGKGLVNADNPS